MNIKFQVRCSSIDKVLAGRIGLTEIQEAERLSLLAKDKLTAKQEIRLAELEYKNSQKELPETVKSYCKDWLKSRVYGKIHDFETLYTEKGLRNEDEAIDMIAKHFGYPMLIKNTEEFTKHPFLRGTPDAIPPKDRRVFDAKNSWSWETFPLFEDEIPKISYQYQVQGYMEITGRDEGYVVYCLTNTPDDLIEVYAKRLCLSKGYGELDIDIYNKLHEQHTYFGTDKKYLIKAFKVDQDMEMLTELENRVSLCRDYMNVLCEKFKLNLKII